MTEQEQRLQEIEARCARATDGERVPCRDGGRWIVEAGCGSADVYADNGDHRTHICQTRKYQNAKFIAHSREDIPWLLSENRRLKDKCDRLQKRMEDLENFTRRGKEVGCYSCLHRGGGPVCDDCKLAWPGRWEFEEGGERDEV